MARAPAESDALVAKIVGRNLRKTYQGRRGPVHAIVDFSLDVAVGEFLCLVGPSGCGKRTFLRLVAGLPTPSSGEVEILRRSADHGQPLTSIVFFYGSTLGIRETRRIVGEYVVTAGDLLAARTFPDGVALRDLPMIDLRSALLASRAEAPRPRP